MKGWFSIKLEKQIIYFICTLLILHLSFRFFDWPGQIGWLIIIPVVFSIINLFSFITNGIRKSLWDWKYFLIALLYFMISLKVEFRYYNLLVCLLIVLTSFYILKFRDFKISKLRYRLISLTIINILLIVLPDISLFKYIHASDNINWGDKLEWNDFQGSEPSENDEMDARIDSDIYWKFNRMYNFPRIISLAIMEKSNSWVRLEYNDYEGNLLKHEQLHFDITEWTRREFQDSLYNLEIIDDEIVYDIYNYFHKVELQRHAEYDSISNHGIDFIGQIKWNKRVSFELNSITQPNK